MYGHLQRHHLGKYVCTDCGTVIDDSDDYKKHIDMHDEAKKWECTQCKIRFVRRQHLLIHLKANLLLLKTIIAYVAICNNCFKYLNLNVNFIIPEA